MRIIIAILFLIITLLISAAGFIILIATGKEGIAFSDMPLFLGVLGVYLLTALAWFVVYKKSVIVPPRIISIVSILSLLIPSLIVLLVIGSTFYSHYKAQQVSKATILSHYKEQLITWPTLPFPVGLSVEFTVDKGAKLKKSGDFGEMILWMGPEGLVTLENFYRNKRNFAQLQRVLFNEMGKDPEDRIEGEDLKIVRMLYPNVIEYIQSPNAFCKKSYGYTVVEDYYYSSHINSLLFWHRSGASAEISGQFRPLLEKGSQFENNPLDWRKMHEQFTDQALIMNGFKPCQIVTRKNCFCK